MSPSAEAFVTHCETTLSPSLSLLGVHLWLTPCGPDAVTLQAIWSHQERRAGHAGQALRRLCALADDWGLALFATVHPLLYGELDGEPEEQALRCAALDKQALDAPALEAWYARHGFSRVPEADPWNPTLRRGVARATPLSGSTS